MYIKYALYIKYIMKQKHITITDDQFQWVKDEDFKLSGFVQKKLAKRIEERNNEQTHHSDCTITYGT